MENPIKQIVKFNQEAGFINGTINPWLEATYLIEEAIEGYDLEEMEARLFRTGSTSPSTAKDIARRILGEANKQVDLAPVDILDKALDAAIFAIGSMAKLGLNANEITLAFNIVMRHNFAKLNNRVVDAEGKLSKPANFEGPEKDLQALLDGIKASPKR